MYKIYINETPLLLLETKDEVLDSLKKGNFLLMKATGKQKQLFQVIDSLEKAKRFDAVILHSEDPETHFELFKDLFKILEAAGGIITNDDEEVLFIFRRNFWDLPKGKIDKGETPGQAAVREVEEETGIKNVFLGPMIGITWHTYKTPRNRILKKTFWYQMKSAQKELILQKEEDIVDAKWLRIADFKKGNPVVYQSILDILNQYEKMEKG